MDCALKKRKCPICGREFPWENNPYRPFCSRECKLVDLYNWLSEKYRMPTLDKREEQKEIKE
ncbi:MAG: DNA gyrase inhibitor YacG [Caldimicrobium sp.]|nr:DNA gyrase inhibitor YacG [Caldimicrobium sp.]MCX7614050.1 DNA gyrase inhibitor YacG [Caldimicrobium sp.]MDW8182362.1 DNA gyrase inhibitor YacG [Caldimicrobium sp.]